MTQFSTALRMTPNQLLLLRIQFSIYEPPSPVFLQWLRSERILVVAAATLNPNATANLNPMKDSCDSRLVTVMSL